MGSAEEDPPASEAAVPRFEVGKTYVCAREINGSLVSHPGTIVKKRQVGGVDEVYVHYVEVDRRLDEWVPQSRLGDEVLIVPSRDKRRRDRYSISSSQQPAGNERFDGDTGEAGESAHKKRASHGHGHFHELTKVRNIEVIQLGKFEVDCWYYSPYPGKFGEQQKLYICEQTFKYFSNKATYEKYLASATRRGPPGKRVYNDPERSICVYEIDGAVDTLFGQNLCLFGKLFIEHKTLSYDPAPFFFYVLYEEDSSGLHPVGYFSKEKDSKEQYNLACIVALPPYQRKGYGKFIISLSYEVTKRRNEIGSPEKPLSDLGRLSYRSYWSYVLLEYLAKLTDEDLANLTLTKMSQQLGFKPEDIISTLHSLKLMHQLKGQLVIRIDRPHVQALLAPYVKRRFAAAFAKPEYLTLEVSNGSDDSKSQSEQKTNQPETQ
mmetsp:Transcript_5912/g.11053  ORF Transcript_5912/g.11053 Transcript_5912/m.11053 type:complete len:434 (-) Transcript_5912:938-2239(-)